MIEDAPAHPRFAFRPETSEEPFHAFRGRPPASWRTLGRCPGRSKVPMTRTYAARPRSRSLQTVATVLADLVASACVWSIRSELAEASGNVTLPRRFQGAALATEGWASGQVVHHGRATRSCEAPVAEDPDLERARLRKAIANVDSRPRHAWRQPLNRSGGRVEREILDAFRLFVDSSGWIRRMYEHVDSGSDRRWCGHAGPGGHPRTNAALARCLPA